MYSNIGFLIKKNEKLSCKTQSKMINVQLGSIKFVISENKEFILFAIWFYNKQFPVLIAILDLQWLQKTQAM